MAFTNAGLANPRESGYLCIMFLFQVNSSLPHSFFVLTTGTLEAVFVVRSRSPWNQSAGSHQRILTVLRARLPLSFLWPLPASVPSPAPYRAVIGTHIWVPAPGPQEGCSTAVEFGRVPWSVGKTKVVSLWPHSLRPVEGFCSIPRTVFFHTTLGCWEGSPLEPATLGSNSSVVQVTIFSRKWLPLLGYFCKFWTSNP